MGITVVRKAHSEADPERLSEFKSAFIISTSDVDRDNDIVEPSGFNLDDYRRAGAPVLWAHDAKQPPVAKSPDIRVEKGVLRAVAEFPAPGVFPFADTVRGLVNGGFIKGASVGFHPLSAEPRTDAASSAKMMAHAWLVTALNPKSITFFVAFLPQFLDRHADFWTQMVIFEATFLALAFANAFGYALVAARARNMVRNPRAIRIFNRAGGSLLVGAGVATVAMRSGN